MYVHYVDMLVHEYVELRERFWQFEPTCQNHNTELVTFIDTYYNYKVFRGGYRISGKVGQ